MSFEDLFIDMVWVIAFLIALLVTMIICWIFEKYLKTSLLRVPISLIIVFCSSPLFYEYPKEHYDVCVLNTDGTITKCPWGTWEWSEYIHVPSEKGLDHYRKTVSVTPITDNPKARKISYSVTIDIFDLDLYLKKHPLSGEPAILINEVNKRVEYELYEFNNAHSRELGELYNPLDPAQQAKLEELMDGFVTPRLMGEGLRIFVNDFQVE